jgi:AcrR family transcriptional regulator
MLNNPVSRKDELPMGRKRGSCKEERNVSEQLLEAATTVFADGGYAGASVNEIVERAGVTKPVLYYYFDSKAGIFKAILKRASQWQEILLAEVLQGPGTAFDRLLLLYQKVYKGVVEYPDLIRLIHNLIFGPSNGAPPYDYKLFHKRMLQAIKVIYADGVSKDEFVDEDPAEVAMLVLGLMDFCFHHDQSRHGLPDPCHPERLLRLAFRGLEKQPK